VNIIVQHFPQRRPDDRDIFAKIMRASAESEESKKRGAIQVRRWIHVLAATQVASVSFCAHTPLQCCRRRSRGLHFPTSLQFHALSGQAPVHLLPKYRAALLLRTRDSKGNGNYIYQGANRISAFSSTQIHSFLQNIMLTDSDVNNYWFQHTIRSRTGWEDL